MPEKETLQRATADKRKGKAPTTQAGEFVREEIHHVREGKHGARSSKQAIAIGLAKARRAGVDLPPPKDGKKRTRKSATRAHAVGQGAAPKRKPSAKRSRSIHRALEGEGTAAASHRALSRQSSTAARGRPAAKRAEAAKAAAKTKGPAERSRAAKKAASTRAAHKSSARGGRKRRSKA